MPLEGSNRAQAARGLKTEINQVFFGARSAPLGALPGENALFATRKVLYGAGRCLFKGPCGPSRNSKTSKTTVYSREAA